MSEDDTILTVAGLRTYFPVRRGLFSRVKAHVRAVDGVDLTVRRGRTLGLVGESGSGRTSSPSAGGPCATCAAECRSSSRTPSAH